MNNLVLHNLSKHYGQVAALSHFTHEFESGQVHALIGKNGSGKSTFVKMIAGAIAPTEGDILIGGDKVVFDNPSQANGYGVVTVHQELSLIAELSVAENIFLGRLPRNRLGLVDWSTLHEKAQQLLHEMQADEIDAKALVSSLSLGQQQLVEIVKAISENPRILLLDEPTSSLAHSEVSQLFSLVKRMRSLGITIIYITHRLSELPQIADTVTAIRDGQFVDSVSIKEASPAKILDMMFGDIPALVRPSRAIDYKNPLLSLKNMACTPYLKNVSLDLFPGEVLGIAGMLGSGRTELLHCIFGAKAIDSGQLFFNNSLVSHITIEHMKSLGVGYASEDRKHSGLVQILSSHENLCLAGMKKMAVNGFLTKTREAPSVHKQINHLAIKVQDTDLPVSALSGGNQQKIVIGNWMNDDPQVLLLDEPARGVDVHAKRQIFEIIWEKAKLGLACIVVSTELEDLTEVCDRIVVLRDGVIAAEYVNENLDAKVLYAACMSS